MKHLFSIAFLSISLSVAALAQTSLKVGSAAPVFAGNGMDGKSYDLNELRGSVVVLTFWSTRCEICSNELPKVNQIVDKYSGKNVVFLALTTENDAKVASYTQKNPLASVILPNSFGVLLQYADRTQDGSIDMGFPSYFVIDGEGLIRYRSSGYGRTSALKSAIGRLAAK